MTGQEQLEADVKEILFVLRGNPQMERPGLVDDVRKLTGIIDRQERDIAKLQNLVDKGKYFLMGGILMGGYGLYEVVHKILGL